MADLAMKLTRKGWGEVAQGIRARSKSFATPRRRGSVGGRLVAEVSLCPIGQGHSATASPLKDREERLPWFRTAWTAREAGEGGTSTANNRGVLPGIFGVP